MKSTRNITGANLSANAPAPSVRHEDQRREPRYPAHGAVEIRWSDPIPVIVRGSLVDTSHSGFRMSHNYAALEAGTIVDFTHDDNQGKARVVWTRLSSTANSKLPQVESGFLILE